LGNVPKASVANELSDSNVFDNMDMDDNDHDMDMDMDMSEDDAGQSSYFGANMWNLINKVFKYKSALLKCRAN